MLALTYPDGARVQRCDYLPENLQISPLFIEDISPTNEIESNYSKSGNDYASRLFRRRLERRGSLNRNRNRNRNRFKNNADIKNNEENYANVAEFSSSSSSSNSILRSLPLCGFRCDKSSIDDDDDEVEDPVFKLWESSQSETSHCRKNFNHNNDDDNKNDDTQRFKISKNLNEEEKLSSKTRRRELPGRESWPGGRHPKDRCFLQLLLILVLIIIIGCNKHCGHFGSRMINRSNNAFGVFTIGTTFIIGRVNSAPVDIVTDTGVRSERSANLSHITGTSRKIQMFIKNRHLQILPDGTVNGSNDDTSDYTILQRASVSRGQLRIQGVATCLYLCMDSCGLLYGSREYTEDCVFNETLEQHNYNTYSSAHWSTPKKTLYLGLSRYGQPRRVQAQGHNLGRLSGYARVLTKVVAQDRVEGLHRRMMGARHNVRHHHGSQQTICPAPTPQEKDGRDKFRCRKRKKRKKRRRKCRAGEIPGPQCDVREITGISGTGHHPGETQSKRSCEGAALDEACRREALETPAKKRKSRIEDDDNLQGKGDVDGIQDEDTIADGKSRRSNVQLDRGLRKKGNKKSPVVNGKKSAAGKRNRKLNNNKNDRNLGKNLRKRGNHQSAGRSVRTTDRLSLSPTSTMMPISFLSSKPMRTTNEKLINLERGNADEILIDDRPKSLSSSLSSSSAVSAVSLAATSLASTLTLTAAVASGEIFTEDLHQGTAAVSASTADIKTENILDLDEFVDVNKEFDADDDDERDDDDDDEEINEDTRITDLNHFSVPKNHHPVTERRLAM